MSNNGSCLCGSVRYTVKGDPIIVAHCHCADCQKQSGAGHTTGAMFKVDNFKFSGKLSKHKITSNNGNEVSRSFCPSCGSLIYSSNDKMTGFITVPLGTFDDSDKFVPEVTVFARNKKEWDEMDDTSHIFNTQPEWEPKF